MQSNVSLLLHARAHYITSDGSPPPPVSELWLMAPQGKILGGVNLLSVSAVAYAPHRLDYALVAIPQNFAEMVVDSGASSVY